MEGRQEAKSPNQNSQTKPNTPRSKPQRRGKREPTKPRRCRSDDEKKNTKQNRAQIPRLSGGSAHLSGRKRPLPKAYLSQVGSVLQGPGGGFDVLEDRVVLVGVPGHADGFERCQHRRVHQPAAHPPARGRARPGKRGKGGKRGETRKGKKIKNKTLRRAGARCAGGRPVPGRKGFTWPREGLPGRGGETPGSGAGCGANQAPSAGPAGTAAHKRARGSSGSCSTRESIPNPTQKLRRLQHPGI